MDELRRWALLIAAVGVAVGTFTGLRRYMAFREARWVETDLRERLFAHLQRLHFAFHDHAQTDRKRVVLGKSVSVSVDLGGCRHLKKKIKRTGHHTLNHTTLDKRTLLQVMRRPL